MKEIEKKLYFAKFLIRNISLDTASLPNYMRFFWRLITDTKYWVVRLLDRTLLRWQGATVADEVYPRRGLLSAGPTLFCWQCRCRSQ